MNTLMDNKNVVELVETQPVVNDVYDLAHLFNSPPAPKRTRNSRALDFAAITVLGLGAAAAGISSLAHSIIR